MIGDVFALTVNIGDTSEARHDNNHPRYHERRETSRDYHRRTEPRDTPSERRYRTEEKKRPTREEQKKRETQRLIRNIFS